MMPAPELLAILSQAYPCHCFSGPCRAMRWEPEQGHIPRGFLGATGTLSEVEVVLVLAEPDDPQPGDHRNLDEALDHAYRSFKAGQGAFHQMARNFFDLCWPGMAFDDQLRRVWVTDSVLCSAAWSTGPVPKEAEDACGQAYLRQQLALFPSALVVALGQKAHKRLARMGFQGFRVAHAFGLPGCRQVGALPSWLRISQVLAQKRGQEPSPAALAPTQVCQVSPSLKRVKQPRPASERTMPVYYDGDALHGGTKSDGVNLVVGGMLERGATMGALQEALTDLGRRDMAARQHLTFLHRNDQPLFVNGEPYRRGQSIGQDDWITVSPDAWTWRKG